MMFVNHIFAKENTLPAMAPGLYEYIVGENGVFVRAQRPEMEALIWVASTRHEIRGLRPIAPYVKLFRRPTAAQVARLFERAYRADSREILFYLSFNRLMDRWAVNVPEQVQHSASVHPVDPFAGGADIAIEVHSHHNMQAFFSGTDDREEQAGFRIYAVIGDLLLHPSILVRVGIYGHFWPIPACWVFDLPAGVHDALYPDETEEIIYERD